MRRFALSLSLVWSSLGFGFDCFQPENLHIADKYLNLYRTNDRGLVTDEISCTAYKVTNTETEHVVFWISTSIYENFIRLYDQALKNNDAICIAKNVRVAHAMEAFTMKLGHDWEHFPTSEIVLKTKSSSFTKTQYFQILLRGIKFQVPQEFFMHFSSLYDEARRKGKMIDVRTAMLKDSPRRAYARISELDDQLPSSKEKEYERTIANLEQQVRELRDYLRQLEMKGQKAESRASVSIELPTFRQIEVHPVEKSASSTITPASSCQGSSEEAGGDIEDLNMNEEALF